MLHKRVFGLFLRRLRLFIFGAQQGVSFAWLSKKMTIYPTLRLLQESQSYFAFSEDIEKEANAIYEETVLEKSGKVADEAWNAERSLCVLLYSHILTRQPKIVIETGVANGITTNVIMAALERTGGELHSFDVISSAGMVYSGPGRWTFHLLKSKNLFRELRMFVRKISQVNLWLHDSNHGYTWQKFEYELALQVLGDGCCLISDDIDASPAFGEISGRLNFYTFGLVDNRKLIGVARKVIN